jgi:hypothetical protein
VQIRCILSEWETWEGADERRIIIMTDPNSDSIKDKKNIPKKVIAVGAGIALGISALTGCADKPPEEKPAIVEPAEQPPIGVEQEQPADNSDEEIVHDDKLEVDQSADTGETMESMESKIGDIIRKHGYEVTPDTSIITDNEEVGPYLSMGYIDSAGNVGGGLITMSATAR